MSCTGRSGAGPLALRPADLTDRPLTALPLHKKRNCPGLLSFSIQASDLLFKNRLDLLIEPFHDAIKRSIRVWEALIESLKYEETFMVTCFG